MNSELKIPVFTDPLCEGPPIDFMGASPGSSGENLRGDWIELRFDAVEKRYPFPPFFPIISWIWGKRKALLRLV
jgi:hypothetical protein